MGNGYLPGKTLIVISPGLKTNTNDQPIGIFDSGIGGLTVAQAIHKRLPGEEIVYLGDTARVPYGVKSISTIKRYALESTLFLLNKGVKLVVVACNTVSAVALSHLKQLLRAPLIGVLDPGAKAALKISRNRRIGIIGTPSTIESLGYQNRLKTLDSNIQVYGKACPLLVPMAEEGRLDGDIVELVLRDYLSCFNEVQIDTLILGCTHYPLFKPVIKRVIGESVELVDSAETTALEVEDVLLREGLLRTHGRGDVQCYVTDTPDRFRPLAKLFFGSDLRHVQRETLNTIVSE